MPGGLGGIVLDADDVDLARPGEAGRLEGRQDALGLEAPVVGDGDRPLGQRPLGHDDHRARGVLQQPLDQTAVGLVLPRLEAEVGLQRQQDDVAATRLALEHLVRRADARDLLVRHARSGAAPGEIRQQPLGLPFVLGHAVVVAHVIHRIGLGLAADRPQRLDGANPRLVDDRQADQRGAEPSGPADAQFGEDVDVVGRVEADQDAAKHDGHPFPGRSSAQQKTPDVSVDTSGRT